MKTPAYFVEASATKKKLSNFDFRDLYYKTFGMINFVS